MRDVIGKLHNSRFLGRIFHTVNYCLQQELKDCESVLDLGCGPSSPLQYCKNIKYSVGVEAFGPYLKESKKKKIHTEYFNKKIEELDFPEDSFDAVIMIEVLEHLPKNIGIETLKKAERWARKKVIVSSPNGFLFQKELDNNPLQRHLSGWSPEEMQSFGYYCRGLGGLKVLRQENKANSMTEGDLMSSIKYNPKFFWFIIAAISQIFTYFIPQLAFELLSVKKLTK